MPLYTGKCKTCGERADYIAAVADMVEMMPSCCGVRMEQVISAPYVVNDSSFISPLDMKTEIRGKAQKRDFMARNNLEEVGNEKLPAKKQAEPDYTEMRKELYAKL